VHAQAAAQLPQARVGWSNSAIARAAERLEPLEQHQSPRLTRRSSKKTCVDASTAEP
jgi:hypothetical protein